jgi:predicted NAD-dependent protein-ADP-ribosyltransferase YbiA (DUF1768 family)
MTIAFTKSVLPFGWMGNMAGGYPITFNDKVWLSAEALFQSMRFDDEEIKDKIQKAKNGFVAKIVAKQNADKMIIEPMSEVDLANMDVVLQLKIDQHPKLRDELLSTGDQLIVEDVTARGLGGRNGFWGASNKTGEWIGQNVLGKKWMKIRERIKTF